MHKKFGFHSKVEKLSPAERLALLRFRLAFLREELTELEKAVDEGDAEGVVDALTDLNVVSIGTLDLFGIDSHEAWDRVHVANMSKQVGVKESRPNPLGLPDLIKPKGWEGPVHEDNLGTIASLFD